MKIANLSVLALAALAFTVGCKDKAGETGDTGGGGADGGTDGGTDGTDGTDGGGTVDSCNVADWGICYEYTDYSETAAWCDSLAAAYGVTATYGAGCTGLGSCSIPAGGDFTVAAEAYYDEATYDAASAEAACTAGGGTWNG